MFSNASRVWLKRAIRLAPLGAFALSQEESSIKRHYNNICNVVKMRKSALRSFQLDEVCQRRI